MMKPSYLDLLGEGSTEHHGLPHAFRGHRVLLYNASDLWLKAHIQHAIGLVKDQEAVGTIPFRLPRSTTEAHYL